MKCTRQKLSILIDTLLARNGETPLSREDFNWILAKKGFQKLGRTTWSNYGKVLEDAFGNRFEIEVVHKAHMFKLRRP